MQDSDYTLVLGIIGLLVVFLPFTGDVYDKRKPITSKIRWRGYAVIFASVVGVWAAIEKDDLAQSEQKKRDNIAEQKRIESNNLIAKTFGEALGKWGYKLDSQNQQITKNMKDISKERDLPNIYIESVKDIPEQNDTTFLDFGIKNNGTGPAFNLNVKYSMVSKSDGQLKMQKIEHKLFSSINSIGVNGGFMENLYLQNYKGVDSVFFLVKLHYTNHDKSFSVSSSHVCLLNLKGEKFFTLYSPIINPPLALFLKNIKFL